MSPQEGSEPPRICYLSYQSRSGSTLLSRLLHERRRVCVTPEGSLPAELFGVNGFRPPTLETRAEAVRYLNSVLGASKLVSWKLPIDAVLDRAPGWPLQGTALLNVLLTAYRDLRSPSDRVVCYKGDPVMPWELKRALDANPGAQAILVMRDPRAVLNSQRRSRYAYAGSAFSFSVAHTADEWRRLAETAAAADPRILTVRYEALVRDPEAVLARAGDFLGAPQRSEGPDRGFVEAVPEAERHLHANVAKPPDVAHIDRWREDLDLGSMNLIEVMLEDEMIQMGYARAGRGRTSRLAIVMSRLRWRGLLGLAESRRLGGLLLRDPSYFMRKVSARLSGVLGR